MKILILTQPLIENYGGILQNYALQTVLERKGHVVRTLNTEVPLSLFKRHIGKTLSVIKQILLLVIGRNHDGLLRQRLNKKGKKICYSKISQFVETHISTTPLVNNLITLRKYRNYDVYIVGSDQVWRKAYSPCLPVYFLNFLPENCRGKKISYAASFGASELDIPQDEIEDYACLLKQFDAVSVREQTGKTLCKKHFDVDAEVVPDPTMLLSVADYRSLIGSCADCAKGKLVTYILDETVEKLSLIEKFAKEHNLEIIRLRGSYTAQDLRSSVKEKAGIDFWLGAIESAEYVVTDSFHGTIFSLLFKKDFFVFVNHARGKDRFDMLDQVFDINSRFIDCAEKNITAVNRLDYTVIDQKFEQYRHVGELFLQKAGI